MEFDKYQMFKNIRFLLGNTNIKLGMIEAESGNQQGYMSRLEKKGNTTEPNFSFILSASKMLNVSVEYLCFAKLDELSAAEDTILRLISKLQKDTLEDRIIWISDGSSLVVDISKKTQIKLEPMDSISSYSLYLIDIAKDEEKPIVFADEVTDLMKTQLQELANLARESATKFRLEEDVKGKIDDYLIN